MAFDIRRQLLIILKELKGSRIISMHLLNDSRMTMAMCTPGGAGSASGV
jgi:hypothetical protein